MNKNTLLLILAFIGLGGGTYYFLKTKNDKASIIETERDFRTPEKDIYKIFIADRENHRVTLTRVGHTKKWMVNGKHPVNDEVIQSTMEVLTGVEIKYIPPKAAIGNIAKSLAVSGIKVELYGQNDVPLKTFYLGGTSIDGHGTNFIKEGSDQPFVMHLPNMVGEIKPRFPLDEEKWRDKTVFAETPEQLTSVAVEYPQQKISSFKINKSTFSYDVLPFHDAMPRINRSLRKGAVTSYLTNFERVIAEGIDNNNAARDSVVKSVPFVIITLKNEKNQQKAVRLFPIYEKDGYGIVIQDRKPDRYFAETSEGDFFLVQDVVFRKFFLDYKSFFD